MGKVLGIVVAAVLAAGLGWAESPRPTAALTLADFESADAAGLWVGIEHSVTDAQASSGKQALTFGVPRYIQGKDERPGVRLPYADGKGFPSQDFSRYLKIVVDIWVVGDKPGQLGLKLRDTNGDDSWTTHITVEPGKWNPAELLIDDAAADMDVKDVYEVVLYSLRSPEAHTFIVDNVRLLPRDKPPVAAFTLRYPNYRGMIFPGAGDIEVGVAVETAEYGLDPKDLALELLVTPGNTNAKAKAKSKVRLREATGSASASVERLPEGPVTLKASLVKRRGREVLAGREWSLRKVSESERSRLKAYIDRANNLVVDGKPFFPLGWYGNTKPEYLLELADSPFNCLLAYATDHVPRAEMTAFLDLMQSKGKKLVYCLNDVYPTATYFEGKNWEGVTGNDAIAAAVVNAYKDHPAVIAWYLNDELPHKLVPDLIDYYKRIMTADPNHPCFIVLCNRSELSYFPDTTDIMGVDPYPIPHRPIAEVNLFADAAAKAVAGVKPVWVVPQAFAWYQYDDKSDDRGRKPTEEELRHGRAPTFEEERCMTYLALTHGAKGLIYYCYYDMRVLPQYEEMWGWMKRIATEVEVLTPMLLSPDDLGTVPFAPEGEPIHTKLKRSNGRLYLMAVNAAKAPRTVTLTLPEQLPAEVEVLFENRKTSTQGNQITDEFKPLEVHVYDLGAK